MRMKEEDKVSSRKNYDYNGETLSERIQERIYKDSTYFQQRTASLISLLLTTVVFIIFLRAYLLTGFLPYWNAGNINDPAVVINYNYHAILAVCGFYVCQVVTTVCYALFPEQEFKIGNIIVHSIFGTAGIILISLSLVAAVRYKDFNLERHLSTSHAWLGVLAIVLYMYNYLNGVLTYFFRDSSEVIWAYRHHMICGIAALHATTISINTGISASTTWCVDEINFNPFLNGVVHFYCRANATVSLLIVLTLFAVIVAVYLHNHLKQRDAIRKKLLCSRSSGDVTVSKNEDSKTDEYNIRAQVENGTITHIL